MTNFKIIGVGGAGCNIITEMQRYFDKERYCCIACDTNMESLLHCIVSKEIQIGKDLTKGSGAGNRPDIGKKAVLENHNTLKKSIKNTGVLVITAGSWPRP